MVAAAGSYLLTRLTVTSDYDRLWPSMLRVGAGLGLGLTPLNMAAITADPRATAGVAAGNLDDDRSSEARAELARFTGSKREAVVAAIHDSFVLRISNIMWLSGS